MLHPDLLPTNWQQAGQDWRDKFTAALDANDEDAAIEAAQCALLCETVADLKSALLAN